MTSWEILRAELLCLKQFARFARRHRRYLVIFAAIYSRSLLGWSRGRAARFGFCFLQLADDLLDGDRPAAGEPAELVEAALAGLAVGRRSADELSRLGRAFFAELEGLGAAGEDPRGLAVELCRTMLFDRRRVLDRLLLSERELGEQHRRTFSLSVDLLMIAARAELRARDCPELVALLGWCSTMRDLEEDLARGLVNIPREALDGGAAAVEAWLRGERRKAVLLLDRAAERLGRLKGRSGAGLARVFLDSMRRFERGSALSSTINRAPGMLHYTPEMIPFVRR